jgi:cob(I)alamin adenosyltransferase
MVKITRVYTRKGDQGSTHIFKARVSKNSPLVEAFGLLDELNAFLGWVNVSLKDSADWSQQINTIQNMLFNLGAFLYHPKENAHLKKTIDQSVAGFEQDMDQMNKLLPTLDSFILPGGIESAARLHMARTVCRRTECKLVELNGEKNIAIILPYINRLSDWLFVVARYLCHEQKITEKLWIPLKS